MLSNDDFDNLVINYLAIYQKHEPKIAKQILRALPKWRKSRSNWLSWWKQQSLVLRIDLQKFLFWLVRQDYLSIDIYGSIHYELTPIQKRVKTFPVSLVESSGTPKFEGGIIDQEWTLGEYSFKKGNDAGNWNVCYQQQSDEDVQILELDLVLSAISFELYRKQRIAKIGFIPHYQQESTHSELETLASISMPTVHTLPTIDFGYVKELITLSKQESHEGLTIEGLLRVRHRAITDSSDESKLVTLWGVIQEEFGDNHQSEKLLDKDENEKLKAALREVITDPSKREKILNEVAKLKKKTTNTVIKESITNLKCANGHNVNEEIQSVIDLRGRLAHGAAISEEKRLELLRDVTFLFAIVDELIETKLSNHKMP